MASDFAGQRYALQFVLLSWVFGQTASAQVKLETRLADEIRSAVALVSSQPMLSEWRTSHAGERIDLAHYETDKDAYEVDFVNRWCVTSVDGVLQGVGRAASFYVPEVARGALPLLPAKRGPALMGSCRLGGVWYEAEGYRSTAGIVKELTTSWGVPRQPTIVERARELHIAGSGLWKDVSVWRRGVVTVWVGWTDWAKSRGAGPRAVVWIVHDRAPDFDLFSTGLDTTAAAAKIAGVEQGTSCPAPGTESAVVHLSQLLKASKSLPPERRAAALLVADSFQRCVQGSDPRALTALGLKLIPGSCPQDGPEYGADFREQAMALDPDGPAGALAALASLQSPCSLKGSAPWPDRVVEQGQKDLRQFTVGPWTAWMHFAIARAHEVKLSFSLPPGEADIGVIHHLTAAEAQHERGAAVAEFARFIEEQPDSRDAVFAWQEAWRLMAGLPPTPTHFGCGCE